MKFKIGDKVIRTAEAWGLAERGHVYTVSKIAPSGIFIDEDRSVRLYDDDAFELVNEYYKKSFNTYEIY